MKKKSHSLSILLLKKAIVNGVEALKDADALESCEVNINSKIALLFHKQSPTHPPSWIKLFKQHVGTSLDGLYNSGTAAVLLVLQAERIFAVTFGYGKSLLKADCYEENFGLRVVLNSVDPDKLRSVDAQSLDAVPVHRRSQASVATSISDFGVDIEQDLIYAATGQPKEPALGKQITGKDALKVTVSIDLKELPEFLGKLLIAFEAENYKERFAWIDNLSEVRDPTLISQLDDDLGKKIVGNDLSRTWLAIPSVIEWSDFGGFKYQQPKRDTARDDIDWPSYLEFIGDDAQRTVETFRKHHVLRISDSSGQIMETWTVYRCIYCELERDGHSFALSNGKWYRVNADFLATLNKVVKSIPPAALTLPAYIDKSEGDYNKRVYETDQAFFALMDKKTIWHGGGSSQIEFCDLYSTDKHLIHVKRYGGSSVLSHLFAQGVVSTQLLLSDADFRNKVNDKLPASHQLVNPAAKPDATEFKLVYAIASTAPKEGLELPLFSKINLRNCYNRLQLLGIHTSICVVPVASVTEEESATA
jgi:uncharacterized protein (TIGR04141 family)